MVDAIDELALPPAEASCKGDATMAMNPKANATSGIPTRRAM